MENMAVEPVWSQPLSAGHSMYQAKYWENSRLEAFICWRVGRKTVPHAVFAESPLGRTYLGGGN